MTDPFAEIKQHFDNAPGVVVNAGRGAQGMKIGRKMFAMFSKVGLILSFPPPRVKQLIAEGQALPFDPGTGKAMKNRVLFPPEKRDTWISLAEEAAASFGA